MSIFVYLNCDVGKIVDWIVCNSLEVFIIKRERRKEFTLAVVLMGSYLAREELCDMGQKPVKYKVRVTMGK